MQIADVLILILIVCQYPRGRTPEKSKVKFRVNRVV